jgi:hypothetical protein
VIRAAEALEHVVPIITSTFSQFFADDFGHGLEPISGASSEQGIQAEAQLNFDDEIKGEGQDHQVQEEPQQNLCVERKAKAHDGRE